LVELLDPFLEATSLTEGDQVVTITFALPSVLALVNHLQDVKPRLKHCIPLCNALLASLNKRFSGMLQRVQVPRVNRTDDVSQLPYGSDIYLISTFFDPKFRLRWIDKELKLIDEDKEDLRKEITGISYVAYDFLFFTSDMLCCRTRANFFIIFSRFFRMFLIIINTVTIVIYFRFCSIFSM
jgi:hypothetical protein